MENELSLKNENQEKAKLNIDYLTLRKYLGILGIILPIVLIMGNNFKIEESISHYYYTKMSVVFTGVLAAFGLFLISYNGFIKKEGEVLSDNFITNCAGILAFVVAIVPTACSYCDSGVPNGHNDTVRCVIHLISAGLFITIMGFMSFNQFAKSTKNEKITKRRKKIYRICGIIIWAVVGFLLSEYLFEYELSSYDTFWGESVALIFFGIAWLTKSKALGRIGI